MAYVPPEQLIELFNDGSITEEEYQDQLEENYYMTTDFRRRITKTSFQKFIDFLKSITRLGNT